MPVQPPLLYGRVFISPTSSLASYHVGGDLLSVWLSHQANCSRFLTLFIIPPGPASPPTWVASGIWVVRCRVNLTVRGCGGGGGGGGGCGEITSAATRFH